MWTPITYKGGEVICGESPLTAEVQRRAGAQATSPRCRKKKMPGRDSRPVFHHVGFMAVRAGGEAGGEAGGLGIKRNRILRFRTDFSTSQRARDSCVEV